MSHLSIRRLPPDLYKAIKKEAQRRKTTKTQIVIEALKQIFHLEKGSKKIQRDVRHFFGKMSASDFNEFRKITADFTLTDEEIWK